jgi:hypothetical protein
MSQTDAAWGAGTRADYDTLAAPFRAGEATIVKLRHWSGTAQEETALLHKRKGRWKAFRWAEVEREVARRTVTLKIYGFENSSRLAVSGAYEPDLIFIALAALTLGGMVLPVARSLRGKDLATVLAAARPTHAFVQSRRTVAHWVASPVDESRIPLFSNQPVVRDSPHWQILMLDGLPDTASAAGNLRRHLHRRAIGWIDEGTEWQDGLTALLDRWLSDGITLAFPETEGSATRDRREVQPTALLSSETRQQAFDDEIRQRLAGWSRRFVEARPRHPLTRLITGRRNAVPSKILLSPWDTLIADMSSTMAGLCLRGRRVNF